MKIKNLEARVRHCVEFRSDIIQNGIQRVFIRSRSLRDLDIPTDTLTFSFYDLLEITASVGKKQVRIEHRLVGSESSPYYYGEVYTWTRLHREFPDERSILFPDGSARALRTILGQWHILNQGDKVISPAKRRRS